MAKKTISVICPVHNEEENIKPFYARFEQVVGELDSGKYEWELLFTNNGSTDRTREEVLEVCEKDERVKLITYSRNFGYQCSIFGGLENASGDLFMIVDVDCEDPPEMLHQFLEHIEEGYSVVYGIRDKREEFIVMHLCRKLFYRVNSWLSDYDSILDMAEFFMIDRSVRDAITSNKSNFPFLRAEIGYVGFKRKGIAYKRAAREHGVSHYNLFGNFNFALAGIFSSSTLPLRISAFIGLPLLVLNFFWLLLALIYGVFPGFKVLVTLDVCFVIYSVVFISLYVARTYKNTLRRPLYFIDHKLSKI